MKTAIATAFAALTIAAPAQAQQQPSPLDRFTWARALSLCLIEHGRGTVPQIIKREHAYLMGTGMTTQQYRTFNAASAEDQWIGERVRAQINRDGGCPGVLAIVDAPDPEPQSKPMPTTRPAFLY